MRRLYCCLFVLCLWGATPTDSRAQTPELVVQSGHSNMVSALAFSPNSRLLASGGADNTVRLWDIETGKCLRTFFGHQRSVEALAFDPQGALLASGEEEGVRLWDVAGGRLLHILHREATVCRAIAFSPDGHRLAVVGFRIVIWDVATGQMLRLMDPRDDQGKRPDFLDVRFSPDGKTILTGDSEKMIRVWNIEDGRELPPRSHQKQAVSRLILRDDGKQIVTYKREDNSVQLWDVDTETVRQTWTRRFLNCAALSRDGSLVVTGDDSEPCVAVWDAATGRRLHKFFSSLPQAVAISADAKLVAGAIGTKIALWSLPSGSMVFSFPGNPARSYGTAFSPDGQIAAGVSLEVRLWNIRNGRLLHRLQGGVPISFRRDGKALATSERNIVGNGPIHSQVDIWDVETGRRLQTLPNLPAFLKAVEFSANGETLLLAWAEDNDHGRIQLWNLRENKPLRTFALNACVFWAGFSPDNSRIAVLVNGKTNYELRLLDAVSGKALQTLTGAPLRIFSALDMRSALFSPDGKAIALWISSSAYLDPESRTQLWEVATGKPLCTLRTGAPLAFTPDSRYLATVENGTDIGLWDVRTSQRWRTLKGSDQPVVDAAISRNGTRMVSSCGDASLSLWDLTTGTGIARITGQDWQEYVLDAGSPLALAASDQWGKGGDDHLIFTPDGYYMGTRSAYRYVAFRVGSHAYPCEQFDLKFNRPDIVLQRLGSADQPLIQMYAAACRKRLRQMNYTPEMLGSSFHLPELAVTTAGLPTATDQKRLTCHVRASDSDYPLDRLLVYVNDVPANFSLNDQTAAGSRGLSLRERNVKVFEGDIRLELSSGRNRVQVSVLNSRGAESLRQTFEIVYDGPSVKPDLYVIAVGVSMYADEQYNLRFAHKDAQDLSAFFEGHKDDFGQVHVLPLTDRDATRDNILKQAGNLLRQAKVDDQVVLFFAGHGLLDEKLDYYYATHDMDFDHPARQGLSYEAIEGLLDGIANRRKLLLMDTCHSGEVDKQEAGQQSVPTVPTATPGLGRGVQTQVFPRAKLASGGGSGLQNSFALMQELFADLRRGSGTVVISAASGEGYSLESEQWHNGVFTASVLEALQANPQITVSALRQAVFERVQALTGGKQTPTVRQESLEFDFRVY